MVSAAALAGLDAVDREGERIGSVVDAMIACDSGRMAYATVSVGGVGGVGEKLFAVPWRDLRISTDRSEEHTSELQSLMRISYAVFCWKKKKRKQPTETHNKK